MVGGPGPLAGIARASTRASWTRSDAPSLARRSGDSTRLRDEKEVAPAALNYVDQ